MERVFPSKKFSVLSLLPSAFPAPPPPAAAAQCDMEILSSSSSATLGGERGGGSEKTQNYVELQPVVRSPTGAPRKTLTMVTSSTGESFIPDYPDLLNIQQPQPPHSPKSQPLNPAALVIPPTPPAQFPHQFQHLIHTKPKNSHVLVSPLLSPPAQFSSETNENKSRGYVTLPRKLTASSTSSSRGPIDWSTMSDRPPIYDGVGPRTSATGGTQRPALPDLEVRFLIPVFQYPTIQLQFSRIFPPILMFLFLFESANGNWAWIQILAIWLDVNRKRKQTQ